MPMEVFCFHDNVKQKKFHLRAILVKTQQRLYDFDAQSFVSMFIWSKGIHLQ